MNSSTEVLGGVGVDRIPQLPAHADEHGMMHVWCCHCCRWHRHGRGGGHRAAHCTNPANPYLTGGYTLIPAGSWSDAFGAVEESSLVQAESDLTSAESEGV